MAVNQSQVDHIITAASEDDPEVKLQNLEREVDLIKTSIKRLLMDIRERMNELENPFTLAATGAPAAAATPGQTYEDIGADVGEAKKSALEAREAALDARESQMDATRAKMETEGKKDTGEKKPEPSSTQQEEKRVLDEQMLTMLKAQLVVPQKSVPAPQPQAQANEKLRLQKVYKLFKWTNQSVRKFGHDRLEIMLDSYQAMGYITKESTDEIREISRLMPANLGEEHEVGPDEFVAELYALNRILSPNDTSLDRDMIEVMMEQRQSEPGIAGKNPEESIDLSSLSRSERKSPQRNNEKDEEWMNLPDRI